MSKNVLLADDDPVVLAMTRHGLIERGYHVTTCQNGTEAVTLLRQLKFEVLVTDIMMPDMDGLELIRAVRAINSSIIVIAISGNGRMNAAEFLKIAKAFGADDVLPKPVNPALLADRIELVADGRHCDEIAAVLATDEFRTDSAPVSAETIAELKAVYGPAISRFTTLFIAETQSRLDRISHLIDIDDRPQLHYEAHTLKGTSMGFGCTALIDCARRLEIASRHDSVALAFLFADMETAFGHARLALTAAFLENDKAATPAETAAP